MPIDASIYSQFAPRVQSPMDVQNGLTQGAIAGVALQNQRLQAQQAQNVMQQRNGLAQAMQAGQYDITNPAHQAQMVAQFPDIAPTLLKTVNEGTQSAAKARLDTSQAADADQQAELRKIQRVHDQTTLMAQQLSAAKGPADVIPIVTQHVDGGLLDKNKAIAEFDQMPKQPGPEFDAWKAAKLQQAVPVLEQQKQAFEQIKLASEEKRAAATNDTRLKAVNLEQAGANSRNAATIGAENARAGATIQNQRLLAGMNPDGSQKMVAGPDGQIDLKSVAPEDLAAAYRYKTDGTFPPNMGRGVQGAAEGRKIRAIASALDAQAGDTPEDARVRQLAAKGDIAAVNKMRQREVAVGANVKNFDFNADQVLQLSGKVDRSGVPLANAWINAGRRSVTGNPDLAAFDTAIKTTVNEFAQIVSGTTSGATAEGEKKKAEALLNAQQTPEQIIATVNQMRIESQNRMRSFQSQRAQSMPTNAPRQPEAAPAPASLPSGWKIEKVK